MSIEPFLNKVFHADARELLRCIPTGSVDAVITDAMYGTGKHYRYDWGADPGHGDPLRHWRYHEPLYLECLRVLKPGGRLAWGQGAKFLGHFRQWFGGHRVWTITRFADKALLAVGNIWIVQTREQRPVEMPHRDSLVVCDRAEHVQYRQYHPCPKPIEEMIFLVEALSHPGQTILDCCCGLGSTLIAADRLKRRWIGCDISRRYCQIAMKRLDESRKLVQRSAERSDHPGSPRLNSKKFHVHRAASKQSL